MAKKVTFDEKDNIVKIKTAFCNFCDKEYRPCESTADHPEQYCSQGCEVDDNAEDTDGDFEDD